MVDRYFVPDADPFEYKNELLQTLAEVAHLANENSALRLQLKQSVDPSEVRDAALEEAADAIWQYKAAETISSELMFAVAEIRELVRALKSKKGA